MKNPKTTILGYLTILGAVLQAVIHIVGGNFNLVGGDIPTILAALAGIGLVAASDGGH